MSEKPIQVTVIGDARETTLRTNNVIAAELLDFGVMSCDERARKYTLHLADAEEFDRVVFLIQYNS